MERTILEQLYDPETFRKKGHRLIDQLADHLAEKRFSMSDKAITWKSPEQEMDYWLDFLENGEEDALFASLLRRTTHIHHPQYIGHQVSPTAPITALTHMLSGL